jgi:hypothetical protein
LKLQFLIQINEKEMFKLKEQVDWCVPFI